MEGPDAEGEVAMALEEAAAEAPPPPPSLRPWVEKHRPARVEDVAHQEQVVRALKAAIQTGQLPHMLYYGPPGTGKTSAILAVARTLYGPELMKTRVLELNASQERGIKVIRERVKGFAQQVVSEARTPGFNPPRFKLIILDEADTMTREAQAALRRTMETYSRATRFCLICNYVTRIMEPLASRCAKFRFQPLPREAVLGKLREIATIEGAAVEDSALSTIVDMSQGDMRRAVTYLQSAHQLAGGDGAVTARQVADISGQAPAAAVEELWAAVEAGAYGGLQAAVENMTMEGYPLSSVLLRMHEAVLTKPLSDVDKAMVMEKIAQADQRINDGAAEDVQLLDLAGFISRRIAQSVPRVA